MKKHTTPQDNFIEKFLTFKDELGGEEILINILNDLRFTDDIETQMNDVVTGFMLSGKLESLAEERFEITKVQLDELESQLDEKAREYDIVGRATDTKVRAYIERDENYIKLRKKLIRYRRQWNILRHYNKAFAMKADILRTKSANRRKEYDDVGLS